MLPVATPLTSRIQYSGLSWSKASCMFGVDKNFTKIRVICVPMGNFKEWVLNEEPTSTFLSWSAPEAALGGLEEEQCQHRHHLGLWLFASFEEVSILLTGQGQSTEPLPCA